MNADNAIMIRWGLPPAGRENRALEVLKGLTDWLTEVGKSERIAGFQQFGYNTGPIHERAGFVLIEGSREQMQALLWSDDYRETIRRIALVTTNLSIDVLELGAAVRRRFEGWGAAVDEMRKVSG